MFNSFGYIYRFTSFGESHGDAVGGIVEGFPPGIDVDIDFVQRELSRRKPGQSHISTPRKEEDLVEFISGIYEGKSTGTPIAFVVKNTNTKSNDYDNLKDIFRPSHADYTYQLKYGIRDHRGGGRSSARETIARVVAGALAKIVLNKLGVKITAYTSQIGDLKIDDDYRFFDFHNIEKNVVRCPDMMISDKMEKLIYELKGKGDTIGGVVSCVIENCPIGLGEPIYGKLSASLANAMMSINASKGFQYGTGFSDMEKTGSMMNDEFHSCDGVIRTKTNNSGGIQGGISNGEDIFFKVAFKPVSTILKEQNTVNVRGENVAFKARGRHDSCVVPRAVPIVEAMAAATILDFYLINNKTIRL